MTPAGLELLPGVYGLTLPQPGKCTIVQLRQKIIAYFICSADARWEFCIRSIEGVIDSFL